MRCKLFLITLLLVLSLNLISFVTLVSAEFEVYNHSVDIFYSKGESVRGWINLSLENEPADNMLTAFSSNISILDFLELNEAEYNCSTSYCTSSYRSSNGDTSKTFSLNSGQSKLIGLRLQGMLSEGVTEVLFKLNSNANPSCTQPLSVDILNDNTKEWWSKDSAPVFIKCSESTGCFDNTEDIIAYEIIETPFCEKIKVPGLPSFRVGANIIKGSSSNGFKMIVYNSEMEKLDECDVNSVSDSGKYSCEVDLGLSRDTDIFVCIADESNSGHQINGENINSCGFFGIDNYEDFTSDYNIFVQGGKFNELGTILIDEGEFEDYNSDSFKEYLNDYLNNKYDNDCSEDCIIPIKFISGINQDISLSELTLKYRTTSGPLSSTKFYEIADESAKIDSNALKLDLQHANLNVPYSIGDRRLILSLGGQQILSEDIEISETSFEIKDILPHEAPALVPLDLVIVLEEESTRNLTYNWDFGDGNSKTTKTKMTSHSYEEIGVYDITISVSDNFGGRVSKTLSINVVSPKEYINKTIASYNQNIQDVESQLDALPEWIKTYIKREINIDSLKSSISEQENRFAEGFISDDTAISIMTALLELKVPYKLEKSEIKKSPLYISEEQIDFSVLEELGSGTMDSNKMREDYLVALANWIDENMENSIEFSDYSIYYDRGVETIASQVKVILMPKSDTKIDELFFVVNGDVEKIQFKESLSDRVIGDSKGLQFYDFSESKSIEFLHPEKISAINLPIYLSPKFINLEFGLSIACNRNGECESGETKENCSSDCGKPSSLKVWILLLILLIIALIVYIILQEWYKKKYESHLFKSKNQLFNLINFMYNAEHQGLNKNQILKRLNEKQWNNEQLNFAWKRYKGKRTGMWEIPIFVFAEKKKVKSEIRKRQRPKINPQSNSLMFSRRPPRR